MMQMLFISIFLGLVIAFELFVEYTEMVSIHYKPLLSIVNLFVRSSKLPAFSGQREKIRQRELKRKQELSFDGDEILEKEKERLMMKNRKQKNIVVIVSVILALSVGVIAGYFFLKGENPKPKPEAPVEQVSGYVESEDGTKLMNKIYADLTAAVEAKDEAKIQGNVAMYFAADFFTWTNKKDREDVGGLAYVLPDARVDFAKYATNYYYVNFDEHLTTYTQSGLPEVINCEVVDIKKSDFVYEKTGNSNTYDVSLKLAYANKPDGMPVDGLMSNIVVTLIDEEDCYYVVGVDYDKVIAEEASE